MEEITRIIDAIEDGDVAAAEELLPLVYSELRRIAAQKMASERAGHTLQPTALVHEAYLRLVGPGGEDKNWKDRSYFFAAAAQAMRRILIESARRKQTAKRGENADHTPWDDSRLAFAVPSEEIVQVDEALKKLEQEDPALAKVVSLRYFAGMTVAETAAALGVSPRNIDRQWRCAKAWLHREITQDQ